MALGDASSTSGLERAGRSVDGDGGEPLAWLGDVGVQNDPDSGVFRPADAALGLRDVETAIPERRGRLPKPEPLLKGSAAALACGEVCNGGNVESWASSSADLPCDWPWTRRGLKLRTDEPTPSTASSWFKLRRLPER